ncbi:MAG: 3-deoxy-D-manno-octulosonic acid transferase [Pseudomonadota bacterium]
MAEPPSPHPAPSRPFGNATAEALARAAYSALLRLGAPAYLLKLWTRGRDEPLYRAHWAERFGFLSSGVQPQPGAVWIHAVSLGETRAAAPLVAELRSQQPDIRLLITHGTATGREAGRALLRPGDAQAWLPYDTPGGVRRFLRRWQPRIGVLMETEVWPNLQHAAHEARLPMVLANARLSDKSLRQGQRLAALMQPAARSMVLALAQTEADAHRLRLAGVPQVEVCGNLKFDMTPDATLLERGRRWRAAAGRPVVLLASSREGEEALFIDAWAARLAARAEWPVRPLLWIVPRHPQRFDEVAALAAQRGARIARRSGWAGDGPAADACRADIWIGDSVGEMPAYYGAADVALLGGSYAPLGGQNLIEAAACGCPLVLGPSTFNFAEAAEQSLAAGAAVRVADAAAGIERVLALLADADQRRAMAQAGLAFSQAHRGAARCMAGRILQIARDAGLAPAARRLR